MTEIEARLSAIERAISLEDYPSTAAAVGTMSSYEGDAEMKDLDALITRLEAATKGSRELDGDIYVELTFARAIPQTPGYPLGDRRGLQHNYTTSIDAALTLVPEGMVWDVTSTGSSWVLDTDRGPCGEQWEATHAATPALALCIAALKALAATLPDRTIGQPGT